MKILNLEQIRKRSKEEGNSKVLIRARQKFRLLERDNWQCVLCGNKEDLTFDHLEGTQTTKQRQGNNNRYTLKTCRTVCNRCHTEINTKKRNSLNQKKENEVSKSE